MMTKKEIEKLIEDKTDYIEQPHYKGTWDLAYVKGYRAALYKVLGKKEPPAIKWNMVEIIKRAHNKLEKKFKFGIKEKE